MSIKKSLYWLSPFIIIPDVLLLWLVFNYWWQGLLKGSYIFPILSNFLLISIISLLLILFCFYNIIKDSSQLKALIYYLIFTGLIFIISLFTAFLFNYINPCSGEGCMGLIQFPFYLSYRVSIFISVIFFIVILPGITNLFKKLKTPLLIGFFSAFIFSYILSFFITFIGNYELDRITSFLLPLQLFIFPIFLMSGVLGYKIFKERLIWGVISLFIFILYAGFFLIKNINIVRTSSIIQAILFFLMVFVVSLFYFGFAIKKGNSFLLFLITISILVIAGGIATDFYINKINISDNYFRELGQCDNIISGAKKDWCYSGRASAGGGN